MNKKRKNNMLQRKFFTGDEWLFYKLYTGPKTADKIITGVIYPVVTKLLKDNLIDKWFFLRYGDPKYHIRFRVHIPDTRNIGFIINALNHSMKSPFQNQFIWNVQTDTYSREIERYGNNTMEIAESLFFYDSDMISRVLSILEGPTEELYRWLFSVKAIDQLLSDFKFQISEKHELLESLKNGFGREFGMNKSLKLQLDKKFRKERPHINQIMKGDQEFNSFYKLLAVKSENIKYLVEQILTFNEDNKLNSPLNDLMKSYIHMMCNRLFKSKQRLHELVIYDFMERYYKSEIAKAKQQSKKHKEESFNV